MAEQIVISKYGAYLVDDAMKYYLVQWTSDPWIVKDGPLETNAGVAREGEWVCKGLWLCPNLDLQQQSAENDLPRMNAQYRKSVLALNPIRLSDENHDILMDAASLWEGLDYVEEIPDSASETSASDVDVEEEDDTDNESSESDEE